MADEAKQDRYIGGDVFPRSGHSPEAAVVPCLAPRHPRSRSDPRLVCRSPSRRLRHGAARPIRGIARMPGRRAVRLDQRPGSAIARIRPRRNPIAARLPLSPAPDVTAISELARSLAEQPRAGTLFGAPEGHDAATIGSLVAEIGGKSWLHVCR